MLLFHLPVVISTSVVAYVYPLYASYKAITAPSRLGSTTAAYDWRISRASSVSSSAFPPAGTATKSQTELAELETWLMYWSIIAVVQTCETFFGWSWSWLPFYDEAKLLFTFWLVSPQTQGASYLYTNYMGPFLADHEHEIDAAAAEARTTLKQSVMLISQRAYYKVREVLWNIPSPPPEPSQPQARAPWNLFNLDVPGAVDKATSLLGVAGAGAVMDHVRSVGDQGPSGKSDASPSPDAVGTSFGSIFATAAASPSPAAASGAVPVTGTLNRSVVEQRRLELQRELAELDAQLQRAASVASDDSDAKQQDSTSNVISNASPSVPDTTTNPLVSAAEARRPSLFARWFGRSSTVDEATPVSEGAEQVVEEDEEDSGQSSALSGGYAVLRRTTADPWDASPSQTEVVRA